MSEEKKLPTPRAGGSKAGTPRKLPTPRMTPRSQEAGGKQKVVIIGGGFGGLTCAKLLEELENCEVTVLERNSTWTVGATHQYVATNRASLESILLPLDKTLHKKAKILIKHTVTKVDTENKKVMAKKEGEDAELTFEYDHLIIAAGMSGNPEKAAPGLDGWAYDVSIAEHSEKLYQNFSKLKEGDTLTIVICDIPYKCPPSPYEYTMLLIDMLKRRELFGKVAVKCFTPEPQCMPSGGEESVVKVQQKLLAETGKVEFFPNHKLKEVKEGVMEFENGEKCKSDFCVAVYPQLPPSVFSESGIKCNPKGFIISDPFTFKTEHKNVYAIGDSAWMMVPSQVGGDPKPHAKNGEFAYQQSLILCKQLKNEICKDTAEVKYEGLGVCYLECGEGKAMKVNNDVGLYAPGGLKIADPSVDDYKEKINWINGHIGALFPEEYFLKVNEEGDSPKATEAAA